MMIPTLGIHQGKVVKVNGRTGEMSPIAEPEKLMPKYALTGDVTLVDLDAAMGKGENRDLILGLLKVYPCRVAGGIRTVEEALFYLDAGAEKVVIGTAATPEVMAALPKSRLLGAIDIKDGQVVTGGGATVIEQSLTARMDALKPLVSGVVLTAFDSMGSMEGIDMSLVKAAKEALGKGALYVAGGVSTVEQIAELDKMDIDVHVGAALHTEKLNLADGIVAPIKTDREDGLFATVVVDELGQALGLAYSNMESIREAVKRKMGAYHSRRRGLWVKGLTSGNTQELLGMKLDCDRDALFLRVTQTGAGFCHKDTWTCWGEDQGVGRVARIRQHGEVDPAKAKVTLAESSKRLQDASDKTDVVDAAAGVMDATLQLMASHGVDLRTVETALYKRGLRVSDKG